MENAKQELLNVLNNRAIKCAFIRSNLAEPTKHILRIGYLEADYNEFFNSLDFEYDDFCAYDGQKIYGNVWLNDGTWLSRCEYEGIEAWVHNTAPEIPKECKKNK